MSTTKTTKRCECNGDLNKDFGSVNGKWSPTWSCNNCGVEMPRRENKARCLVTPSQQRTLNTITDTGLTVRGLDEHTTPGPLVASVAKDTFSWGLIRVGRTGNLAAKFSHAKKWCTGRRAWAVVRALAL